MTAGAMSRLSHLDAEGRARMVDVTDKAVTAREAVAEGYVRMAAETRELALAGTGKKGEVIATAELAGVMAAKRTADLIPLCHPLALSSIRVAVEPSEHGLRVMARVKTTAQTGVEMEALTAVSVACLTLVDMTKSVDPRGVITGIRLETKTGGKSGPWQR